MPVTDTSFYFKYKNLVSWFMLKVMSVPFNIIYLQDSIERLKKLILRKHIQHSYFS